MCPDLSIYFGACIVIIASRNSAQNYESQIKVIINCVGTSAAGRVICIRAAHTNRKRHKQTETQTDRQTQRQTTKQTNRDGCCRYSRQRETQRVTDIDVHRRRREGEREREGGTEDGELPGL